RSVCTMAIRDAYTIPITANVITVSDQKTTPSGTTGNSQRTTPNNPIFTISALRIIVTGVGDCSYVSGCHVWNGNIGILIANAIKMSQNTHCCWSAGNERPALIIFSNAKAAAPGLALDKDISA